MWRMWPQIWWFIVLEQWTARVREWMKQGWERERERENLSVCLCVFPFHFSVFVVCLAHGRSFLLVKKKQNVGICVKDVSWQNRDWRLTLSWYWADFHLCMVSIFMKTLFLITIFVVLSILFSLFIYEFQLRV